MRGTRYLLPGAEGLAEFITNDLPTLDMDETLAFYTDLQSRQPRPEDLAFLACNDRFFLLVGLCKRRDVIHPWIFARCREVEANPDGYLDLWARGHYKALALDTPILTPDGWRKHGDLKRGDKVYGPDGTPRNVVATTAIFTDADCYEVNFDDGERIIASGEHLWTNQNGVTLETRVIAQCLIGAGPFEIPVCQPISDHGFAIEARNIVTINPVPTVPVSCIQVDGADGLYVVGEHCVTTHNSTIVTFAGTIQDIVCDPEITIGIFSYSRSTAQKFLMQIMGELERNEDLKLCFPDVFYWKPDSNAPRWGASSGLVCKRIGNPKEATVEAWGLVEGQPTGVHFKKLMFDDLIEKRNVNSPEQILKATEAWELSDNLGVGPGTRKAYVGTRYLIGDTYETMMDRKSVKVRIYPATHNGREDGKPVMWDQATWDKKRIDQRSTLAAQLLQNPAAGKQATFSVSWMRSYSIRPTTLNIYIMADPSRGRTSRSDRTGMVVIGIDYAGNKYLLDGARHRMSLSQRWDMLKMLHDKWRNAPGVQLINVGYERYGQQSDDEYFQEKMRMMKDQDDVFAIEELAWPNAGGHSKSDRVERLQPDMEKGNFFLSPIVKHPEWGDCYWKFEPDKDEEGNVINPAVGKIAYTPKRGPTSQMRAMDLQGQGYRVPAPITRRDEDGNIYDLTLKFIEEMLVFPFGAHDELPDVTSRIYDMKPSPAVLMETLKPIDVHTFDA